MRGKAEAERRPRRRRSRGRRILRALLAVAALWVTLSLALVLPLRWIDPPTSAFMLRYRLSAAERPLRHRWVVLREISPQLAIAVVAAEDQKFPRHRGFDVVAIQDALSELQAGERRRGASTISQQVAKNLYLWPASSWPRKALEAWFTVLIEALWTKRRILEVYLNVAEFGAGVYGAQAAAESFFGKHAAQLDAADSARLAAVLPNPRTHSAAAPGPHVLRRQQWIERQMIQLGGPDYLRRCCSR